MNTFRCPRCGSLSVLWDARAGYFLCRSKTCAVYFPPPNSNEVHYTGDIGMALTHGRVQEADVQNWIDKQRPETPTPIMCS